MVAWLRYFIGLWGINLVIFVHEFGHFITCKLFGVPTPVFSIGFGPKLVGTKIGSTLFQIALLPIGGYVQMSEKMLQLQPFWHQAIIILAGVVFNIIFGGGLLWVTRKAPMSDLKALAAPEGRGFIGPFGIMRIISNSLILGGTIFWRIIGILSINIGLFNLLPIPFFDGGQLVVYGVRALHTGVSNTLVQVIYILFFILLVLFFMYVTLRDIFRKS